MTKYNNRGKCFASTSTHRFVLNPRFTLSSTSTAHKAVTSTTNTRALSGGTTNAASEKRRLILHLGLPIFTQQATILPLDKQDTHARKCLLHHRHPRS